jgi:iron complex transport system ATP-binding protein
MRASDAPARKEDADGVLLARELWVRRGGKPLLQGVSLTLGAGEVLAVVGPNGAGKSTLLRTLCGDLRPSAGELSLNGRRLHDWSPRELAERRAVLLQTSPLSFAFTALEVVLLGRVAGSAGWAISGDDERRARAILQRVGLRDFPDRLYPTLSGGEQQRVQLARILFQLEPSRGRHPQTLFLDEPTANLDLEHQRATLELCKGLAAGGTCVLVVLHDLNLAARYADRVLVLSGGKVAALAAPDDALSPALIEDVFHVPVTVLTHGTRRLLIL